MKCRECGAELDPTLATCASCGTALPLRRLAGMVGLVCRQCDFYNALDAAACRACGAALGERAPATAASPVAGAPPAPRAARARLVVERGEAAAGTTYELREDEERAGRAEGRVQFPDDPCLAPFHVTFLPADDAVVVRDEGAAGGVYIRVRGASIPLRPGTLFAVGDRLLRFGGAVSTGAPAAKDGTVRLGSPRPSDGAVLIEEWLEGGLAGRSWVRPGEALTIGGAGCSVELDDPRVATVHAQVTLDGGAAHLNDGGSADGIFVRLQPGGEQRLGHGDAVRIGREVLRVEIG